MKIINKIELHTYFISLVKTVFFFVVTFFIHFFLVSSAQAADFYVLEAASGAGTGLSWENAWNDFDDIDWTSIVAGDTLYIGQGTYTDTLYIRNTTGTELNPLTIQRATQEGYNGEVNILGSRDFLLPECGTSQTNVPVDLSTYYSYGGSADVYKDYIDDYLMHEAGIVVGVNVSYVIIDGIDPELAKISKNVYGVVFDPNTSNITLKNFEIFDNGRVVLSNRAGAPEQYVYTDEEGVRVAGQNHVLEYLNIYNNGQDAIQSRHGDNQIDNFTIRNSWMHNTREHSGYHPEGATNTNDVGDPLLDTDNRGFNLAFNWCSHSDGLQLYTKNNATPSIIDGLTVTNSFFGPGLTQGIILNEESLSNNVSVNNISITNSTFIKTSDNGIYFKAGGGGIGSENVALENVTIFLPNMNDNNQTFSILDSNNATYSVTDSVFAYGRMYSMNTNEITYSGVCMHGIETDFSGITGTTEVDATPIATLFPNLEAHDTDVPPNDHSNASLLFSDYTIGTGLGCTGSTLTTPYTLFPYWGGHDDSVTEDVIQTGSNNFTSPTSTNFGRSYPKHCSYSSPEGSPELFQIDREGVLATLYLNPANNRTNRYAVMYGENDSISQHGAVMYANPSGVVEIRIDHLKPWTDYSFRVQPVHECTAGTWSGVLRAPASQSILKSVFLYPGSR